MKIVLPATAVALLGMVLAWPHFSSIRGQFRVGFADVEIAADDLSMVKARFVGTDGSNRPYTITAQSVRNLVPEGTEVELETLAADMALDSGSWVVVAAERGTYRVDAKALDLSGSVRLFHDSGHEFLTDEAKLDLDERVVSGRSRIEGHGPLGELEAEGYRLSDEGNVIRLDGAARMVIYPEAERRAQ